ncbi:MAG: hypothetical protein RIC36_10225 [Rhodospirillales bacterium]
MARMMTMMTLGSASIAATLLLSACVAPQSTPPTQVSSDTPSVKYEYRGDDQLINANQRAMDYCAQYNSAPGSAVVSTGQNGKTEVKFDCDRPLPRPVATLPPTIPVMTRTYQTDQQLVAASQDAQRYCQEQGSTLARSSVSTNTNGSRTATFECTPR